MCATSHRCAASDHALPHPALCVQRHTCVQCLTTPSRTLLYVQHHTCVQSLTTHTLTVLCVQVVTRNDVHEVMVLLPSVGPVGGYVGGCG